MNTLKFELTESQQNKVNAFIKKHKHCKNSYNKYGISYIFMHSGIGLVSQIKCNGCGDLEDMTDVNTW